ncbi:unnamed protein product [Auanema sp. JU1783]|nr:unnamed protein product [Auanema sp. JU1783]
MSLADCSTASSDLSGSQQFMTKTAPSAFSAAALSVKAQKKLASKLANRTVTRLFISDATNRLLDDLSDVLKEVFPKKDAEKVVKNIIKLSVKIGILAQNNILNHDEINQLFVVQKYLHSLALAVISFQKVAYSYERSYFLQAMSNLKQSLAPLVGVNLSDKSMKRLDHVFDHLTNMTFCDGLFKVNGPYAGQLTRIISHLECLLDEKSL